MQHPEVAIVGGGIAGLSAAVACHRKGIDAHVFEAAPAFEPLGTSLSIWPNAMRCLGEWGLDRAVARSGERIEQVAWRRPDGTPFFVQPLGDLYEQLGAEGYCTRRSDLHSALLSAIPPDRLHLDHALSATAVTGDGVDLTFGNGRRMRAGHVVAADGLWSRLRATVLGDREPVYSGYGAWLGLSSAEAPKYARGEGCEFLGPNARIGVFETGRDTRYWFVIANADTPARHARTARLSEMEPILDRWPERFRNLVSDTSIAPPVHVSFFDRPVARTWSAGNITLVGDAMHPFVPNLGQGACQAIEDGHVLAEGLHRGMRGADLNDWMRRNRLKRVRYMRRAANRIGRLAQNQSAMSRMAISLLGRFPFRQATRSELKRQFERPAFPPA